MKLRFTIYDLRFTIWKKSSESAVAGHRTGTLGNRKSPIVSRKSREGIALVITLILLSVTLVMAVAFLAISRREAGSVVTSTDTVTARLAADAALANAQAQIIASVLATQNPYNPGLLVSTNFVNANGFTNGAANPLNVNYDYLNPADGGGPLTTIDERNQNIANLLYLPRAPVFVPTNSIGSNEFRFYLDLNRNGQFEDTRSDVPNVDYLGHTNGFAPQTGDPQWVGVLERPDAPHGPNNKFVSRYAFVAVPADGSLDLNAIHNQVFNPNLGVADGYFRNQGVGSWEINLAAFLADLNTNQWDPPTVENAANNPYTYLQPGGFANTGAGFEDARALLTYRYNNNYNSLATLQQVLGAQGYLIYQNGAVDSYTAGKLMTNSQMPFLNVQPNNTAWAGADNTNHFFSLSSDLFDPNKGSPNFTNHLSLAGNDLSTYDRYTFYRMLAQLGTDSAPAQNQVNLNYANATAYFDANGIVTNIAYFANAQTNLVPWDPLQFFTITADRLLREYSTTWFQSDPTNYLLNCYGIVPTYIVDASGYGVTNVSGYGMTNVVPAFGITNIPVWANGRFVYSSSVQRVLQLTANIYDATSTNYYPSRFRPLFTKVFNSSGGTDIHIFGYVQQLNSLIQNSEFLSPEMAHPYDVESLLSLPVNTPIRDSANNLVNVYGVPWVIGAKKGFPNFNEFTMENSVQVTRKLQFNRDTNTVPASGFTTNQMYLMSITNYYGVECWNSYTNKPNYTGSNGLTGPLVIAVRNEVAMALTNLGGYTYIKQTTNDLTYTLNFWPSNFFVVPLNTNDFLFTNAVYVYNSPGLHYFGNDVNFTDPGIVPLPQFGLLVTNHLQMAIIDYSGGPSSGQIIDYVELNPLSGARNINTEIADVLTTGLWSTNLVGGTGSTIPQGVINQYYTSRNGTLLDGSEDRDDGGKWANVTVPGLPLGIASTPQAEQIFFQAFFSSLNTANYLYNGNVYTVKNLQSSMEAPYTPTRLRVQRLNWQVNDPLVHYLGSDLTDLADDTNTQHIIDWPSNLGQLNNRYQPWGGNPSHPPNLNTPDDPGTANAWNTMVKDPLVTSSSAWSFPTNKLPTVGWLGRVHRGTPWQTVYLKAENILKATNGINNWSTWVGAANLFDATNTAPLKDRLLFDNFSTALDDNATRGQLSVNQDHLAAWSAVFSGIAVPTSLTNSYTVINPAGAAGTGSMLGQMITNINYARANFTNADGLVGSFEHVGDLLTTPALTEQSPFLTTQDPKTGVNDALMEWLPQQTMSLLRVTGTPQSPMRYVIYSYGQTLKPAPGGVVTGGPNLANGTSPFGMVTNYQVVAETATRTVVQLSPVITANLDGTLNTNYSSKIEQFNVLPPD